eukprot:1633130-Rhodomonas_salina.1
MAAAVITTLRAYIAAFNAHNIEATLSHLDADVQVSYNVCIRVQSAVSVADDAQVFLEGSLAAEGRETIKPSYVGDFEAGKQGIPVHLRRGCPLLTHVVPRPVSIVEEPVVVEEDGSLSKVKVVLQTGKTRLD